MSDMSDELDDYGYDDESYDSNEDEAYDIYQHDIYREDQHDMLTKMAEDFVHTGIFTDNAFCDLIIEVKKKLQYYRERDYKGAQEIADYAGFQLALPEEATLPQETSRVAWRKLFALAEFWLLNGRNTDFNFLVQ
jgi:hypothetical protein